MRAKCQMNQYQSSLIVSIKDDPGEADSFAISNSVSDCCDILSILCLFMYNLI